MTETQFEQMQAKKDDFVTLLIAGRARVQLGF